MAKKEGETQRHHEKFLASNIKALIRKYKPKPGAKSPTELRDAKMTGFGMRITPSGHASYVVQYSTRNSLGKKIRPRYPIGPVSDISLADARDLARDVLAQVRQGKDPARERIEARNAPPPPKPHSFGEAVDRFVAEELIKQTEGSQQIAKSYLARLDQWRDRPIKDIGRLEIIDFVDAVVASGRREKQHGYRYAGARVLSILRVFFGWAKDKGLIDENPAQAIRSPFARGEKKSRERFLTEVEIARLWPALDKMGFPFGSMGKMLLVTGQRRAEVAKMRWAEVDLEGALWTLSSDRTKADREHLVPLSSLALEVLAEIPHFNEGDFVFTTTAGAKPVSGYSKAKRAIDELIASDGGEPMDEWRFHDLRRTLATHIAGIRHPGSREPAYPPHILGAVLNHSPGALMGVTSVYNRWAYLEEKREALEAWANRLRAISDPTGKVVTLENETA
ncbi:MAG: integrase arm-type DNA-binding domain-containing protein [Alphaproteobacteria bacterium]|nr:integrase arm-type DNA-binding domain-containing protein [Alphaproteobacteria bacterium]